MNCPESDPPRAAALSGLVPGPRRLHHIGFVVGAIAAAVHGFTRSLDASWDGVIFEDPNQKVKVTFLRTTPTEPQIELVEPSGEDSPILKFLRKGGGLHHFCYETGDLAAELQIMRSRRAVLVSKPKPAVAFNGRHIAWVVTQENLLIEFLESETAAGVAPGLQ